MHVKSIHLMPVPDRRLFAVKHAARYIDVSVDTLKKYTDMGFIKAYDFFGRRAYRLEDLDAAIDALPQWEENQQPHQTRAGTRGKQ